MTEFVLVITGLAILVGIWLAVDAWKDWRAVRDDPELRSFAFTYIVTQNGLGMAQTLFFLIALIVALGHRVSNSLYLLVAVPVVLFGIQLYTFVIKRRRLGGH